MTNKDELGLGELVPALREGSEAATWTEALKLCARAAYALTTLIAERDGLREALEPFAACADHYAQPGYNMLERVIHVQSRGSRGPTEALLTRGDFAIARTALSLTKEGEKP